jgi:vitamin B12 transporter
MDRLFLFPSSVLFPCLSSLPRSRRRRSRRRWSNPAPVATLVLALAHAPAWAQAALESVVVTATRVETPVERTLADTTVIEAREIRDSGASTLTEVLRRAAGIEISQTGGAGSVSGLFIRGTRTAQTLVLVDGIRVENASSGGALLEFLPISAIDRIEIVRAPASALYGSAAIGGVVQIFTRKPGESGFAVSGEAGAGSRGTQRLQAAASGAAGATGFSIGVAHDRTDGYDATISSAAGTDADPNRVTSVTAALTHRLGADWRAGFNLLVADGNISFDVPFPVASGQDISDYRSTALSAFVTGRLAAEWESTLRVGSSSIDYSYPAYDFAPRTDSRTISWQNSVDAWGSLWIFGAESLDQRIAGQGLTSGSFVYEEDSRRTNSAFAEWQHDIGAHLLRVGARYDDIEDVGAQTSGSVGWGWRVAPGWLLRAGWASAFRAPTFDDLYNPFSANPTLKPERSNGYEVAAEWRRGLDLFKATAFANRIRDAIELDETFTAQNLETATIHGVTVEGRRRVGALMLRASATFQDPRSERTDPATGETISSDLSRRARRHASAGVSWDRGPWRLGVDAVAQGERVDTTGARMAGYAVVDARADYRVARHWQLFGWIGNLGDREYETASGYRMPPRTLFVGVRYGGS